MKIKNKSILTLSAIIIFLSSCSNNKVDNKTMNNNVLSKSYSEIENDSKGQDVNIFMWGGDSSINKYMDGFVAKNLKEKYDINLNRTPMDASNFIQKLSVEKKADKNNGTMDIIWVNGESFVKAKNEGLLLGNIFEKLPNGKDVLPYLTKSDAGEDIDGLEVPWGKVLYAFQYNSDVIKEEPKNVDDLLALIKNYPNKFTYPEGNEFTGNGFIKVLAMNLSNKSEFGDNLDDEDINRAYEELKNLAPYLYKEGKTYPSSIEQLDNMFSDGEIYFSMGFNENRAISLVKNKIFPENTKTVVLGDYTLSSAHYLSIPFNAPNKEGAMVAINYLISEEAQLEKLDTDVWGDGTILNKKIDNNRDDVIYYGEGVSDFYAETTNKIKETWQDAIFK